MLDLDGKKEFAAAVFALAILTKPHVAVLLPFYLRSGKRTSVLFFCAPFVLFLPYLASVQDFFAVPFLFATEFHYNGPVHHLALLIFNGNTHAALLVSIAVFTAGFLYIFLLVPSLLRSVGLTLGLLLFCLPTVHPWYFLVLTPHAILFGSSALLVLHFTALAAFFFFDPLLTDAFFLNRTVIMALEFIPVLIVLLYELSFCRRTWPIRYPQCEKVSVIIPCLNEDKLVAECIESVLNHNVHEIIIADGGSVDATDKVCAKYPVQFLQCPKGRGIQIATAAKKATGDVIVILHADSRLKPGTIADITESLRKHPCASGGSVKSEFRPASIRSSIITLLNNTRVFLTGISFGDQVQFYRTSALPSGFPELYLMEDVELSLKLKENGTLITIPDGAFSSPRRWAGSNYLKKAVMVVFLSAVYLISRNLNLIRDKGKWFYRRYYEKDI
jgi:hypothetical protein